jgi:single-stranded-DNA-specific exonuclease
MTLLQSTDFTFPSVSITGKTWSMRPEDIRLTSLLVQQHNLPEPIARILSIRKILSENVETFLSPTLKNLLPDPFHLKDLEKGVDRLIQAIQHQEHIVIFGDYDVDGATSTALFLKFFQDIGVAVSFYIPDRQKEGYGPNINAFKQLKDQGTQVIITVDCGTTSFETLQAAHALGLSVIVIDHHISEPKLPLATAVINPNRLDESSPYKYLAAVGVTFLTIVALNQRLKQTGFYEKLPSIPNLLSYLDLVALGTVCDVVPLIGLNRAFVKQGLKVLRQRGNCGLTTLSDVAGLSETPDAYHLGFVLGPRINAGGRVGEASLGTLLLSASTKEEAYPIAMKLHGFNQERQEIEQAVLEDALERIEKDNLHLGPILCIGSPHWHLGVIGIVAGRLKEKYNKPVFVLSFDENQIGKGSGRSISGIDLGSLVHAAKQEGHLIGGGGHAMAAGITVHQSNLEAFCNFLTSKIVLESGPETLWIDGVLTPRGASLEMVELLDQLGPFGPSHPTPRFLFTGLRLVFVDVVGEKHIRCTFADSKGDRLSGIAFRSVNTPLGEALLQRKATTYQVVGTLRLNHWQGTSKVQLTIEDIAKE